MRKFPNNKNPQTPNSIQATYFNNPPWNWNNDKLGNTCKDCWADADWLGTTSFWVGTVDMAAEKEGQGVQDTLLVLIKLKSAQKFLEKLRNVEGLRRISWDGQRISWDGQVHWICMTKCLNDNERQVNRSRSWSWDTSSSLYLDYYFLWRRIFFSGNGFQVWPKPKKYVSGPLWILLGRHGSCC